MKRLLSLFALSWMLSVALHATPAGILTWIGTPIVGYCDGTGSPCAPMLGVDPTGISSSYYDWEGAGTATVGYDVGREFTVTSAGDFLVTNTATVNGSGFTCDSIGLCGLGLTLDFTAGSTFGAPISETATDPGFDGFSDDTLAANSSNITFLDVGTYTLWQGINTEALSAESSELSLSFETDMVGVDPVPEPNPLIGIALLCGGFLVAWGTSRIYENLFGDDPIEDEESRWDQMTGI